MNAFPAVIESYLDYLLRERAHPLLLSFDNNWRLQEVLGDAAFFLFSATESDSLVQQIRDLFVGLATDELQDLPFVQLADGRAAHVHLVPDAMGFHVLLLDAGEEHQRTQAQQQLGHQARLASLEKSRALARLRQIKTELEQQRARQEEAHALKSALITTLSHDFRTPLTSIFGYLHLLERRQDQDVGQLQALNAIRRNATYLFALAENLLEYGRGEPGESLLNPVQLQLVSLLADVDAMFRPLAAEKGLGLSLTAQAQPPSSALFDDVKLRQVLINLISNALRYTERGDVRVVVGWDGAALQLEIADTGVGIAEVHREDVFKPFNRGAQLGSRGAGLGLSIVSRLVERMRGRLDLASVVGSGTTIRICLPPLVEPQPPASAVPAHRVGLAGVSAIVVDDDPDIAALLEVLLSDLGVSVRLTAHAAAAVESVISDPPDLVLVDVELPGLSGNAAVYQMRSQGYKGCIITLSAGATEAARQAALAAGADHYLTKPLDFDQFARVIRDLGARRRE